MARHRSVVVTGIGAVCAAGSDAPEIWRSAIEGRRRAEWFDLSDDRIAVYRAPPTGIDGAPEPHLRRADRCVRLAVVAGKEAAAHARLGDRPPAPERIGVFMGTSRGPVGTWDEAIKYQSRGSRQPPSLLVNGTLASLSGSLSVAFGARGPSATVSATCASGAHAIALGAEQIAAGLADVVIAGGSDAPLQPALLEQFRAAGLLGTHGEPGRACRPFDKTRNGTVLGEGAGVLVIESLESARQRGVPVLAELAGWGLCSDAAHRAAVVEEGDGIRRAMAIALERAAIDPSEIGYINAHGTGTEQNDLAEGRAAAAIFGGGIPCSSTKPVTGHCAGATPAIEAIISILALRDGFIPPTATCEEPDPECFIDPVPRSGRAISLHAAMSNSLGIWGTNAALIFKRCDL